MLYLIAHRDDCAIVMLGSVESVPVDTNSFEARLRLCTCGGTNILVEDFNLTPNRDGSGGQVLHFPTGGTAD